MDLGSHNDKEIPELLKTLFTCREIWRITTNLFLDTWHKGRHRVRAPSCNTERYDDKG